MIGATVSSKNKRKTDRGRIILMVGGTKKKPKLCYHISDDEAKNLLEDLTNVLIKRA